MRASRYSCHRFTPPECCFLRFPFLSDFEPSGRPRHESPRHRPPMRAGSLDFPAYVGGICGQARRCGYGFFWLSGKAWRARRPRIP